MSVVENSCSEETWVVDKRGEQVLEQLTPSFAEMLYPELTTCLKSCMVENTCEQEEEEEDFTGSSIRVEEEVGECSVRNLGRRLFRFA